MQWWIKINDRICEAWLDNLLEWLYDSKIVWFYKTCYINHSPKVSKVIFNKSYGQCTRLCCTCLCLYHQLCVHSPDVFWWVMTMGVEIKGKWWSWHNIMAQSRNHCSNSFAVTHWSYCSFEQSHRYVTNHILHVALMLDQSYDSHCQIPVKYPDQHG